MFSTVPYVHCHNMRPFLFSSIYVDLPITNYLPAHSEKKEAHFVLACECGNFFSMSVNISYVLCHSLWIMQLYSQPTCTTLRSHTDEEEGRGDLWHSLYCYYIPLFPIFFGCLPLDLPDVSLEVAKLLGTINFNTRSTYYRGESC